MKLLLNDLKKSPFSKLYLAIFTLISITNLYLVINREKYIIFNSLEGNITEGHYEYINNITSITTFLESLLLFIGIVFLIKIIFIKDKINLKQFFLINLGLFLIYGLVGSIISVVIQVPIGNLMQLLLILPGIIIIGIILSLLKALHKKKTILT